MRFTNSQVRKAGQTLRQWLQNDAADDELDWALDVLEWFRATHLYPLSSVTHGLRSIVRSERCRVAMSQRLKRRPTILGKLRRHPTLQLSRMQDVGGCRAVLASIDDVRRVERRLCASGQSVRVSDYIAAPKSSGYRGVHFVVEHPDQDGVPRLIEVQLRTTSMHEWATSVEQLASTTEEDLKSGAGSPELLARLATVSGSMAEEDARHVVPTPQLGSAGQRIKHFLLVYDHRQRKLIEIEEFMDGEAAVAAYDAKERPHLRDRSIEVVLLGSDSLDTIKFTHRNYFDEYLPDSFAKHFLRRLAPGQDRAPVGPG